MAGKTTPWWRDVFTRAVRGIRGGLAAIFRPGKKPGDLPADSPNQEIIPEEEALSDHSPQSRSELSSASAPQTPQPAPETPSDAAATQDVQPHSPVREVAAAHTQAADAAAEIAPPSEKMPEETSSEVEPEPPQQETHPNNQDASSDSLPESSEELVESPADVLAEAALEIEAMDESEPQAESAPEPELSAVPEEESKPIEAVAPVAEPAADDVPGSPADLLAEAALEIEAMDESEPQAESAPEPELSAVPEEESKPMEAVAPVAEPAAEDVPESPADLLAEAALGVDLGEAAAAVEPALAGQPPLAEQPDAEPEKFEAVAQDPPAEDQPAEDVPAEDQAEREGEIPTAVEREQQETAPDEAPEIPAAHEPEATAVPESAVPAEVQESQSTTLPPQAAAAVPQVPPQPAPQVLHQAIKREQGPDTSPVSVFVNRVYEGPFDLLLDLIRKQDIDIYDIPIATITAQFLAYVNQLKATDMDVAGEFIYTASLLIHIKSKMLLPREPKGGDEGQEDPRRELVERLLEHERFKNAAQMLQQKQMLEAATWTNPGVREFREIAGESEIAPEIAADTTDLVRVFRTILERARNRPVINVEEDSVTVGQMIQFLGRRLTMEDKPVALRRLLAHTRSERALIAMFLALLELVRLQAILLRQDRQFSEIFIKKNSGFEAVMNQGMARDDWQ